MRRYNRLYRRKINGKAKLYLGKPQLEPVKRLLSLGHISSTAGPIVIDEVLKILTFIADQVMFLFFDNMTAANCYRKFVTTFMSNVVCER